MAQYSMQQAALRRLASQASQIAFRVGLAVPIEIRAAQTSQKVYVRLLSSHLHSILRAFILGAVLPHSIRVLTCQAKLEKPLRNAANVAWAILRPEMLVPDLAIWNQGKRLSFRGLRITEVRIADG